MLESVLFEKFARWQPLINDLKSLEKLLGDRMFRERFQGTCMRSAPDVDCKRFNTFSASLGGLRWEAITEFCAAASRFFP